jgi:hypothetical protein
MKLALRESAAGAISQLSMIAQIRSGWEHPISSHVHTDPRASANTRKCHEGRHDVEEGMKTKLVLWRALR